MTLFVTPAALIRLNTQTAMMLFEAQAVIAMRMMGMAGLWRVARSEDRRMVAEKPSAMISASLAGGQALLSGKGPHGAALAAMQPIRARTRANARRLARRGPGAPS